MDIDEYKTALWNHRESHLGLLGIWATDHAVPWIRTEMEGILGRKLPRVPEVEAIRNGLTISIDDHLKLPQKASFWGAQLVMFEKQIDRYLTPSVCYSAGGGNIYSAATERELREGVIRYLYDAIMMLEAAGHLKLDLLGAYGAWGAGEYNTFSVYKAAEQTMYGRYSGLTHTDQANHVSIGVLRTAIELRIRRAFEIQALYNTVSHEITPISISSIMNEVLPQARHIYSQVDLHDVYRVYRWTNPYLHAGRRDYSWVVGFCIEFLRPLFVGPKTLKSRSGTSMHGGLEMSRVVWTRIRRPFKKIKKKNVILLPSQPQPQCILFDKLKKDKSS